MKQRDLIRKLRAAGWWHDKTRDGDHYIFKHDNRPAGKPNRVEVPRHTEIKERLAQKILKDAGL